MSSQTFTAGGPLRGHLRVPGDKSISHRSLMFAALAEGGSGVTTTIRGLSSGDDVARTRLAMEAMGAQITDDASGGLSVVGGRSRLHEPDGVIDLGNSGTGIRLLSGWCANQPWLTILSGDESLHKRPMARVVEPLRRMGAQIDGRRDADRPPLVIRGSALRGIDYTPPVASAQLKSAVLIAGLAADSQTIVREPVPTRAHTEEMLADFGVDITNEEHPDGSITITLNPSPIKPFNIDIPGDPSQAAFWMVAAAVVPDSDVTIENVYLGPGRGGIVDVLMRMGADIELTHHGASTADVRVRHSKLQGVEVGGDEVPSLIDELPVLSIAAAVAEGKTVITDAAEMRVKESDRIAAVAREIGGLGVLVEERPDGFVISGRPGVELTGGTVEAHLDHRIAMTGAIAALLGSAPTTIEGWQSVASSYPTFADHLAKLRG